MLLSEYCVVCQHFLHLFINEARKYLDSFFNIIPLIYDNTSLSINVHNLIHIVDDVEYFNCTLDNISAFPYESMLGKIRKMIRTGNQPLPQVCRRLYEINKIQKPCPTFTQTSILKQKNDCNDKLYLKYIIKDLY